MTTEARPDRILRSGGALWGPERVAAGLSIRQLAKLAGINTGFLSRMEHGRMFPSNDEYHRVMAAIGAWRADHRDEVTVEG